MEVHIYLTRRIRHMPKNKKIDQTIASETHLNFNLYFRARVMDKNVPHCNQPRRETKLKMTSARTRPIRLDYRHNHGGASMGVRILMAAVAKPLVGLILSTKGAAALDGNRNFSFSYKGESWWGLQLLDPNPPSTTLAEGNIIVFFSFLAGK
jgi:hypothetical protein